MGFHPEVQKCHVDIDKANRLKEACLTLLSEGTGQTEHFWNGQLHIAWAGRWAVSDSTRHLVGVSASYLKYSVAIDAAKLRLQAVQLECEHTWRFEGTGRHGSDKGVDYYVCTSCGLEKSE